MANRTASHSFAVIGLPMILLAGCNGGNSTSWEVNRDIDPMTDIARSVASIKISGENADIEIVASCGGAAVASYQFRAFDKSGNPLDFQQTGTASTFKSMQLRRDEKESYVAYDSAGAFANQLTLDPAHALGLLVANKVVARAPLANGTETFEYEQTAANFREAMQLCIAREEAAAARLRSTSARP